MKLLISALVFSLLIAATNAQGTVNDAAGGGGGLGLGSIDGLEAASLGGLGGGAAAISPAAGLASVPAAVAPLSFGR